MSEQQINQILKRLDKQDEKQKQQDEKLDHIITTITPISEAYRTANAIKRLFYALTIAAGTIAGSVLAVRELFKVFKE